MSKAWRLALALWALASLAAAPAAQAAPRSRPAAARSARARARNTFNAGVRAYKAGQFLAAAQAFTEAHKLLAKPEILFSIAQAYRRQFHIDRVPGHLRQALKHYRAYLAAVKTGGRRLEAARALSELSPFAAALGAVGGGVAAAAFRTRLMVSTAVAGAVVTVDGGPVRAVPLSVEVKPGRHHVLVRAVGYAPDERDVVAIARGLVALDVVLQPLPASLEVMGEDGAEVYIDGERRGELPTRKPLELRSGRHLVSVLRRGHQPFERQLDFRRGVHTRVVLSLPQTVQRHVALAAFGTTALGGGATVVLGVLAANAKQQADDIRAAQQAGPITEAQRQEHNDSVQRRDDLLVAVGATAAATGLVALTGLGLLVFDRPTASRPTDTAPADKPATAPLAPAELAARPWLSWGGAGIGARLRFW